MIWQEGSALEHVKPAGTRCRRLRTAVHERGTVCYYVIAVLCVYDEQCEPWHTGGQIASARRMWAKSPVATRLETRTKESNRCASGKVANLGA